MLCDIIFILHLTRAFPNDSPLLYESIFLSQQQVYHKLAFRERCPEAVAPAAGKAMFAPNASDKL